MGFDGDWFCIRSFHCNWRINDSYRGAAGSCSGSNGNISGGDTLLPCEGLLRVKRAIEFVANCIIKVGIIFLWLVSIGVFAENSEWDRIIQGYKAQYPDAALPDKIPEMDSATREERRASIDAQVEGFILQGEDLLSMQCKEFVYYFQNDYTFGGRYENVTDVALARLAAIKILDPLAYYLTVDDNISALEAGPGSILNDRSPEHNMIDHEDTCGSLPMRIPFMAEIEWIKARNGF
jgi:hypothetical protein